MTSPEAFLRLLRWWRAIPVSSSSSLFRPLITNLSRRLRPSLPASLITKLSGSLAELSNRGKGSPLLCNVYAKAVL